MPSCRIWSDPSTKDAYRLSWASLLITALAAVIGFSISKSANSSLALVFALENCVDFLSSAVVLWRFFAPQWNISAELEAKLQRREQRASVGISFILVLLGFVVFVASISDFVKGAMEEMDLAAALAISFLSIPVFLGLTVFKFQYAQKLQSDSLYKDGICSLLGTVLALALFINTLILQSNPSAWWTDPLIALLLGLVAMVYGIYTLHQFSAKDKLPIFSPTWWASSQGDGRSNAAKHAVAMSNVGENRTTAEGTDGEMEEQEIV